MEEEEIVEATEVIKALAKRRARDKEFKKSLSEGMIALLQGQEAFAKSPPLRQRWD